MDNYIEQLPAKYKGWTLRIKRRGHDAESGWRIRYLQRIPQTHLNAPTYKVMLQSTSRILNVCAMNMIRQIQAQEANDAKMKQLAINNKNKMKKEIIQKTYEVEETKTTITKFIHKTLAESPEKAIENIENRATRCYEGEGRCYDDTQITTVYEVKQ